MAGSPLSSGVVCSDQSNHPEKRIYAMEKSLIALKGKYLFIVEHTGPCPPRRLRHPHLPNQIRYVDHRNQRRTTFRQH